MCPALIFLFVFVFSFLCARPDCCFVGYFNRPCPFLDFVHFARCFKLCLKRVQMLWDSSSSSSMEFRALTKNEKKTTKILVLIISFYCAPQFKWQTTEVTEHVMWYIRWKKLRKILVANDVNRMAIQFLSFSRYSICLHFVLTSHKTEEKKINIKKQQTTKSLSSW